MDILSFLKLLANDYTKLDAHAWRVIGELVIVAAVIEFRWLFMPRFHMARDVIALKEEYIKDLARSRETDKETIDLLQEKERAAADYKAETEIQKKVSEVVNAILLHNVLVLRRAVLRLTGFAAALLLLDHAQSSLVAYADIGVAREFRDAPQAFQIHERLSPVRESLQTVIVAMLAFVPDDPAAILSRLTLPQSVTEFDVNGTTQEIQTALGEFVPFLEKSFEQGKQKAITPSHSREP